MPKTIIKIKTWGCTKCNYHQDFEPTGELMNLHFNQSTPFTLSDIQVNECPSCALKGDRGVSMRKETVVSKKMEMTVMGEEDIEPEIETIEDRRQKGEVSLDDPDISTTAKKNAYRIKRKKDIVEAIKKAKEYEDK